MKTKLLNLMTLSMTAMLTLPALAGLPTTTDSHLQAATKNGFYPWSLTAIVPMGDDNTARVFVARDTDLNMHFATCKESKLENPPDDLDWTSITKNIGQGNADITVNSAVFGQTQNASMHDLLTSLQTGQSVLMRMEDKDNTLVECDAIGTFTQQEFMTIAEHFNDHGLIKNDFKSPKMALETTLDAIADITEFPGGVIKYYTDDTNVDCNNTSYQAFFRVQTTINPPEDLNHDECVDLQPMQGSQFGLLYPSDAAGFATDLNSLRKMLTEWQTQAKK